MTSKKKKSVIKIKDSKIKSENWSEIIKSDTRFRILQLLLVYGELSLTALSKHMNMSKPALYHHLQIMIGLEVVKVSKEKKIRGSIHSKYFMLDEEIPLKVQHFSDKERTELDGSVIPYDSFRNLIITYNKSLSLFKRKLVLIDLYIDFLEDKIKNWEDITSLEKKSIISDYNIDFQSQYLTEHQYSELIGLYKEFNRNLVKLIEEGTDKTDGNVVERPYFVLTMLLPMKNLLDLEIKKKRNIIIN